ncbi:MAG: TlpA family protein disulfide reductase [Dehalococcoidia bacterium]
MASKKAKKTGPVSSKKTRSIKVIVIIAIVVMAVGIVLSRSSCSPSDTTLDIITWDETTLSTLGGTPLVLNFWASWCGPCRGELPYFDAVARESAGEIKVVAINVRDSASTIQKFFGDYQPTMIVASDIKGQAFVDYCLAHNNTQGYIPFTLFVDSEGIVKHAKIGAFQSEAELWDTLDHVFGITIP